MKAMILAAGIGERMKPLTDKVPKPLLQVGEHALIEYHLHGLAKAGINEIVVNVSHLADQIESRLGAGEKYGVKITYSREGTPMETAGGIQNALPLLGEAPFLVVNGDVWTNYVFEDLIGVLDDKPNKKAHLVLVENPPQHPEGDFSLSGYDLKKNDGNSKSYTYSGISVLNPDIFLDKLESNLLGALFRKLILKNQVSAEYYQGQWFDIGTPQRLEQVRKLMA